MTIIATTAAFSYKDDTEKTLNVETIRVSAPTKEYFDEILRTDHIRSSALKIVKPEDNKEERINLIISKFQDKKEETLIALETVRGMTVNTDFELYKEKQPLSVKEIEAVESDTYIYYDIDLSDELQEYTQDVCKKYGINHRIALAIMYVETRFQPDKISKTADHGIMQINECNHDNYVEKLGITNFLDAKQGILCGVYMLYDLKTNYGCDTEDKMIMSYPGVGDAWELWEKGIYTNWYVDAVRDAMKLLVVRK